jgi:hypothetical protein
LHHFPITGGENKEFFTRLTSAANSLHAQHRFSIWAESYEEHVKKTNNAVHFGATRAANVGEELPVVVRVQGTVQRGKARDAAAICKPFASSQNGLPVLFSLRG